MSTDKHRNDRNVPTHQSQSSSKFILVKFWHNKTVLGLRKTKTFANKNFVLVAVILVMWLKTLWIRPLFIYFDAISSVPNTADRKWWYNIYSCTMLLLLPWFSPERCHHCITTHHFSLKLCTFELIGLMWTWFFFFSFFHEARRGRLDRASLLRLDTWLMVWNVVSVITEALNRVSKLRVFWF